MQYLNSVLLVILIIVVVLLIKAVRKNSWLITVIGNENDDLQKEVDCHDKTLTDIENHLGVQFDDCNES